MSLNTVWKLQGIETSKYKSCKVIYVIQKLASLEKYDSIVIGFDNRQKSEGIANLIAKGLEREFETVILTERPVTSSLLTMLVTKDLYDMSLYITGDYEDWGTYGFKIKMKQGRTLTFQDATKVKNILTSFDSIDFNIDWVDTPKTTSFDSYYTQEMTVQNKFMENKKLDFNLAFNVLSYTRSDLAVRVLHYFGCKVQPFNADNMHKSSPNPYHGNSIKDNKKFLSLNNYDMIFSLADGESLSIQSKERIYHTEHIALMLAEIQKKDIKKIILPDKFQHLKWFAKKNKIKFIENSQPSVCRTPCTLVVSYNNDIIDSNFSNSMDSLYVLLKILDYLQTNSLTIDEFFSAIIKEYKIKSVKKVINVNEKEQKVDDTFNLIRNKLRKFITNKTNTKFSVSIQDIEMVVYKRSQSIICEIFYHDDNNINKHLHFLNEI